MRVQDIRPETSDQNIIDTVKLFKYTHNKMLNDGVKLLEYQHQTSPTHYDTWVTDAGQFFDDRISSVLIVMIMMTQQYIIIINYVEYVSILPDFSHPITSLTQTNQPLMYRQYITSMQIVNAIISNASQIDDYFLEVLTEYARYIKPTNNISCL